MARGSRRHPVIEVFGPTIQGEGLDQGAVSIFVRFGGCDFRCSWCDSPHAVIPSEVRATAERLTDDEIVSRIQQHTIGPRDDDLRVPWVILTGGNPALHELGGLIDRLHDCNFLVAVETQGTRWKEWMRQLDRVCISPKPPSAEQHIRWDHLGRVIRNSTDDARGIDWSFIKIPCFDEHDLEFACEVRRHIRDDQALYLTAGNDAGRTVGQPERVDTRSEMEVKVELLKSYRWLVDTVIDRYPELTGERTFMQVQDHVLLWGNTIGH